MWRAYIPARMCINWPISTADITCDYLFLNYIIWTAGGTCVTGWELFCIHQVEDRGVNLFNFLIDEGTIENVVLQWHRDQLLAIIMYSLSR